MIKLPRSLSSPASLRWAVLAGLLVGVAFLPTRMTWGYFSGLNPIEDGPDRLQHVSGVFYFVQDQWRWPLFQVEKLGAPAGVSIIYTDSIPLAALLLKLVNQFHPVLFNYFGAWVGLCYALGPACFCWLLYELHLRDRLALLAGAVIGSCVPALLYRHMHAALCAHFLILTALALYARWRSVPVSLRQVGIFTLLMLVTLLVQVYLLAMVCAVFLAYLLQACIDHRLGWKHGVFFLGGPVAICLLAMLLFGYVTLGHGLPPPAGGFGRFSMNLLSPFWPWQSVFGSAGYTLDATGGQYEGYNYLGAGVLFLLAMQLAFLRREWGGLWRRHGALAGISVILTVVALSNAIYLGRHLILEIHLSPYNHFMANFRSSGRFFWPVGYGLMALLIVWTMRHFPRGIALTLLAAAAALQAYDLHVFPRLGANPDPSAAKEIAFLSAVFSKHQRIEVFPFAATVSYTHFNVLMDYAASLHNLPINTVNNSRAPRDLLLKLRKGDHPVFKDHVLYVFNKEIYSRARLALVTEQCPWPVWESEDSYLISSDLPALAPAYGNQLWAAPAAQFRPMTDTMVLDFSSQGDWTGIGYRGFRDLQAGSRQTSGAALDLKIGLADNLRGHALRLHFEVQPITDDDATPGSPIYITVNGTTVAMWTFSPADFDRPLPRMVSLPAELTRTGTLLLHFSTRATTTASSPQDDVAAPPLNLGFLTLQIDDHGPAQLTKNQP